MGPNFYLILSVATTFGIAFAISARGILYHTPDTDNELMAYAAAQSHKWKWPSDVHKYGAGKTSMKDMSIFLLAIFQRIFRDKTTDYPYTVMAGLSVSISGILIYAITANYFEPTTGLIAGLLYLFCFWPWQVSLYGGHVNVANLFFLISIFALQLPMISTVSAPLSFGVAGVMFCFSLFSSSSSYKYFASFFVAASYTRLILLEQTQATIHLYSYLSTPITNIITIFLPIAMVLIWTLLWYGQKWLATKLYYKKISKPFDRIITGQNLFPLEYYFPVMRRKLKTATKVMVIITIVFLLMLNFIGFELLIAILVGFVLTFILLTLPNITQNGINYLNYLLVSPRKTHFRAYVGFYAKQGITISHNMRGAGLSWIPKMLLTFAPFHLLIFVTAFIIGQYKELSTINIPGSFLLFVIALVAISPIIWAEITRAPQQSRLYSPGLITGLLLPAYVLSNNTWSTYAFYTLPLFVGIGILILVWNLWKFIDNVYPARMAARNLMQIISKLGIKDIYTYSTVFNNAFIDAIPGIGKSEYLPNPKVFTPPFRVHYIQQLDEVTEGWIAIPGTSSKALNTTSEIENGDYIKDPILNQIIGTKQIEEIATAKFKTYGTSTIWVNEDDITSYRALHLKDIGPNDLYRGYAWLINAKNLKSL